MISAVLESRRVNRQLQRAKWQIQLTLAEVKSGPVRGRKSESNVAVIKVSREPQARVIPPRRLRRVRWKQVRVGICRRRQIVALIVRSLGVREGQLAECKQAVAFVRLAKA